MTFFAAAIGGGALLGGALISANAAGDAADTQAAAGDRATAAQERMFNKQLELQEPWRAAGGSALNALLQYAGLPANAPAPGAAQTLQRMPGGGDNWNEQAYLAANPDVAAEVAQGKLSSGLQHFQQWGQAEGRPGAFITGAAAAAPTIDPSLVGSILKPFSATQFTADPGYQFRLEQGEKGLQRAAQAGGGHSLTGGAYLKDAMRFNSGLASQEYGNAESRYRSGQSDIWNRLSGLAGTGQQAVNASTNAAGAFGQQVGSNIIGAGNTTAAGQIGSANAINNGITQGISLYQGNALLNRMYPAGGGGPLPSPVFNPSASDWYGYQSGPFGY
jgi:hypothetical protein